MIPPPTFGRLRNFGYLCAITEENKTAAMEGKYHDYAIVNMAHTDRIIKGLGLTAEEAARLTV